MAEAIPVFSTFNPLDKHNLAESVTQALLVSKITKLPPNAFIGAGIYAIYYIGDFPLYKKISERNKDGKFQQPIYVGKAIPAGARKGGLGLDAEPGQALYKRLGEHAKSITEASNLNLEDFFCRFLAVDDIWIPLAESLLIEKFIPLWNRVIDGFGNHDPGKGRYNQQISQWDTIHPGREWAKRLQKLEIEPKELIAKIQYFINRNYN